MSGVTLWLVVLRLVLRLVTRIVAGVEWIARYTICLRNLRASSDLSQSIHFGPVSLRSVKCCFIYRSGGASTS